MGPVVATALRLLCFLGRSFCNLPGPCAWERAVTPSSAPDVAADLPHSAVIAPGKHPAGGNALDYPFIPAIPLLLAASSPPACPPNHTPPVPTGLTHNTPPHTRIKPVSSQPCFPLTPLGNSVLALCALTPPPFPPNHSRNCFLRPHAHPHTVVCSRPPRPIPIPTILARGSCFRLRSLYFHKYCSLGRASSPFLRQY